VIRTVSNFLDELNLIEVSKEEIDEYVAKSGSAHIRVEDMT
jgi:hypothetical protein